MQSKIVTLQVLLRKQRVALRKWESGKMGSWEVGKLGRWEVGKMGRWEGDEE